MDDILSSKLARKLAIIAVFLVGVVLLVGGEDDPGLIAQIGEDASSSAASGSQTDASPPIAEALSRSDATQAQQGDPSLSAWYAEDDTTGATLPEPVEPKPVNESHLINDTVPLVGSAPVGPPAPSAPSGARIVE